MNNPKLPIAEYGSKDKPLRIGDMEIPCYVLENGKRVIVRSGMIESLGMSAGGSSNYKKGGPDRLAIFLRGKILNPFVNKSLIDITDNPIKFKIGGIIAYGYDATVLADICDAVLEARKHGVLQKQQLHIAQRCEILVRGFARVGIIALVDEATGYQYIRKRNELHKILESYISKELLPWAKRFPDEFYQEMFRLRNWEFDPASVKKPILVGKLTNIIVYSRLPHGVLDELRNKNPRNDNGKLKYHHHRFLTSDIGHPHLEKHLASVTALMRASTSWEGFLKLLNRAFPMSSIQKELPGLEDYLKEDDE